MNDSLLLVPSDTFPGCVLRYFRVGFSDGDGLYHHVEVQEMLIEQVGSDRPDDLSRQSLFEVDSVVVKSPDDKDLVPGHDG